MNKKLKYILAVIVIIFVSAAGSGLYYIYDKIITFPDNNEERIIRNVMSEHKTIVDRKSALNSNFNNAIESFGGVAKISKENGTIEIKSENYRINNYIYYYAEDDEIEKNKTEIKKEILQNSKYYNEGHLELYLLLYNYDLNKDLSVEDIKNYVDNGTKEKENDILQYINWYKEYGVNEYAGYDSYFTSIIMKENNNGEYTEKYGRKTLVELSLDKQKEVLNKFNEMGILEKVKYQNNLY